MFNLYAAIWPIPIPITHQSTQSCATTATLCFVVPVLLGMMYNYFFCTVNSKGAFLLSFIFSLYFISIRFFNQRQLKKKFPVENQLRQQDKVVPRFGGTRRCCALKAHYSYCDGKKKSNLFLSVHSKKPSCQVSWWSWTSRRRPRLGVCSVYRLWSSTALSYCAVSRAFLSLTNSLFFLFPRKKSCILSLHGTGMKISFDYRPVV